MNAFNFFRFIFELKGCQLYQMQAIQTDTDL